MKTLKIVETFGHLTMALLCFSVAVCFEYLTNTFVTAGKLFYTVASNLQKKL